MKKSHTLVAFLGLISLSACEPPEHHKTLVSSQEICQNILPGRPVYDQSDMLLGTVSTTKRPAVQSNGLCAFTFESVQGEVISAEIESPADLAWQVVRGKDGQCYFNSRTTVSIAHNTTASPLKIVDNGGIPLDMSLGGC